MPIFGANEYFNVNVTPDGGRPRHIRGITCDVRNCVYHDGDSFCTANRITIGPSYANDKKDTACATFKERSL